MSKKHINIITMGCSKNLVDSEKISGQLNPDKFYVTHDADGSSDIVIVNTCGFIHDAKEESVDIILQYVEAKKQGLIEQIIVTGCLSQRYKDVLKNEIPEADAWFGVESPENLFTFLNDKYDAELHTRKVSTPSHFAFLKIAEGCDRTCSFCAIPLIRGKFISRSIESLVEEAKQLADAGVKEILLIAQDLSYYGYDLYKKSMLAELIKNISKIEGIEWIRLHYAYPKNFPLDVIEEMAQNPKVCKYLDIPLQHISDKILTSMRRNTDKAYTLSLMDTLRDRIPGLAIRTTMLVGYPGETREDFEELLAFVKEYRFDRLGAFIYSPEEGTRAYDELKDSLSEEEKEERLEELMSLQMDISIALNEEKIGKTFKVIIDREEEEYFVGRTEFDSPEVDNEVYVEKNSDIRIGDFYQVEIDSVMEFELFGHIV